ncbi:MAG: hypothetical protein AB1521_08235 [Bacteroidota bacterium]
MKKEIGKNNATRIVEKMRICEWEKVSEGCMERWNDGKIEGNDGRVVA